MFWVLRDIGYIKVEIGLEVIALALLTFWNVPLPEILIHGFDAFIFGSFQIWCKKTPAKKHHFPSYIRTLFYLF